MNTENDDTENGDNTPRVRVCDVRVSQARAAMRHGDTIAAGWWFYGVGPAGTRPDFGLPYTPTKPRPPRSAA